MTKLTLDDLTSLTNQTSAINTINDNNDAIVAALENTLSRDGTTPNEMEADLDMNDNRILNLPEPLANTEPVRLIDLNTALDEFEAPAGPQGETGPQGPPGDTGPQGDPGASLADGDYGDITISGSATVFTIDNDAVTYAKIQNVSATDRLLGRSTAGAGDVEEITCTSFGRSLIDDADATAARTTLGLGTAATQASTAFANASHTHAATDISDSTAAGRTILTAADASAQRTALGLAIGTNVQAQDAELAALAGLTSAADALPYFTGSGTATTTTLTTFGRSLIDDADASAARTTLGVVIGTNVQAYDADTLKSDTTATLTAGYGATAFNAGTKSSGTYTPAVADGNLQYATNGGAHTLAPPSGDCTIIVQYTNNGSAGTITTSGFTKVDGSFTTTNGHDFMCYITRVNSFTHLNIVALQ